MAEGRGREKWAHTSMICALIANANRDPKRSRPFKPADFDPFAQDDRRTILADKQSLSILKEALEARKGTHHGR